MAGEQYNVTKVIRNGDEYYFPGAGKILSKKIFGTGEDGDCVIIPEDGIVGNVFMEAKEYNFNNFTVCPGVKLWFCGDGLPIIRVKSCFLNCGTICLRNPLLSKDSVYADPYLKENFNATHNPNYNTANAVMNDVLLCAAAYAGTGMRGSGNYICCYGDGGNGGVPGINGSNGGAAPGHETYIGGTGGTSTQYAGGGGGGGGGWSKYSACGDSYATAGCGCPGCPANGYYGGKGGDGMCSNTYSGYGGAGGGGGGRGYCGGGNGGNGSCSGGSGGRGGNSYIGNGGNGGRACNSASYGGDGGNSIFGNGGNGGSGSSSNRDGVGGCSVYGDAGYSGRAKGWGMSGGNSWGGIYDIGIFSPNIINKSNIRGNGSCGGGRGTRGAKIYLVYCSFQSSGSITCAGNGCPDGALCTYQF